MRPRQYFEYIKTLPREEWRDAVIRTVPPHLRKWVGMYLKVYLERRGE